MEERWEGACNHAGKVRIRSSGWAWERSDHAKGERKQPGLQGPWGRGWKRRRRMCKRQNRDSGQGSRFHKQSSPRAPGAAFAPSFSLLCLMPWSLTALLCSQPIRGKQAGRGPFDWSKAL